MIVVFIAAAPAAVADCEALARYRDGPLHDQWRQQAQLYEEYAGALRDLRAHREQLGSQGFWYSDAGQASAVALTAVSKGAGILNSVLLLGATKGQLPGGAWAVLSVLVDPADFVITARDRGLDSAATKYLLSAQARAPVLQATNVAINLGEKLQDLYRLGGDWRQGRAEYLRALERVESEIQGLLGRMHTPRQAMRRADAIRTEIDRNCGAAPIRQADPKAAYREMLSTPAPGGDSSAGAGQGELPEEARRAIEAYHEEQERLRQEEAEALRALARELQELATRELEASLERQRLAAEATRRERELRRNQRGLDAATLEREIAALRERERRLAAEVDARQRAEAAGRQRAIEAQRTEIDATYRARREQSDQALQGFLRGLGIGMQYVAPLLRQQEARDRRGAGAARTPTAQPPTVYRPPPVYSGHQETAPSRSIGQ